MLRYGDLLADLRHAGEIEPGGGEARPVGRAGDDMPPGIDDERMAIGLPRVGGRPMRPGLRGGQEIRLGLDRTGTAQHLPMILAGLQGEGRWQHDHLGATGGERLEQSGEAKIVADGAAHRDAVAIVGRKRVPRLEAGALAIRHAVRRGDVEHMDLAVARHFPPGAVEHHTRVVDALLARDFFKHGAGMDVDLVPRGQGLHGTIGGALTQHLGRLHLFRPTGADEVEHLRQRPPPRPRQGGG